MSKYKVAQVKFNGGRGALICDGCSAIIAYGFEHEDRKHYCPMCMSSKCTTEQEMKVIDDGTKRKKLL